MDLTRSLSFQVHCDINHSIVVVDKWDGIFLLQELERVTTIERLVMNWMDLTCQRLCYDHELCYIK